MVDEGKYLLLLGDGAFVFALAPRVVEETGVELLAEFHELVPELSHEIVHAFYFDDSPEELPYL